MTNSLAKIVGGTVLKKSSPSANLDLALSRAGHVSRMSSDEIVDVPRVCAVHDKPYIATFQRGPNGWRLLKTTRTKAGGAAGNAASVAIDLSGIDPASPPETCAWCDAPGETFNGKRLSAIVCSKCGGFICLGRKEGTFFQCRDSCGAAGELIERWTASQGTTRREANPRPVGAPMPRAVLVEPLLLSAGAALTKKGGR